MSVAAARSAAAGTLLIERLSGLRGGRELLELAGEQRYEERDVALVGGAVRDLLTERVPRELDVVVSAGGERVGDRRPGPSSGAAAMGAAPAGAAATGAAATGAAAAFAADLADALGGGVRCHERFGTALVIAPGVRVDVATRRAESYPRPGALPEVRWAAEAEDLARRDFTVNAIALRLAGPARGQLRAVGEALDDLEQRVLRVLHARSFEDDPTRILRLHRYAARLDFAIDAETARLAADAIEAGALATVSRARVGAELALALREPDVSATLAGLERGGVLDALSLTLRAELLADALELLPDDGEVAPLALGSLLLGVDAHAIRERLDGWELPAAEREVVVEAATRAQELARALAAAERRSEVAELLHGLSPETVALAGSAGERGRPEPTEGGEPEAIAGGRVHERARDYLERIRHERLSIDGEDLLAAGVARGPEVGRALRRALARRLDGEIGASREEQLAAALAGDGA